MGEGQDAGSKDRRWLWRFSGHSRLLPDIDPGAHDVIRRHGLKGEESLLAWEAPGSCAWEQEGCVEVLCLAATSKSTSWLRMVHKMPGHHVMEDNRGPGSILRLPPQARKIPPENCWGLSEQVLCSTRKGHPFAFARGYCMGQRQPSSAPAAPSGDRETSHRCS